MAQRPRTDRGAPGAGPGAGLRGLLAGGTPLLATFNLVTHTDVVEAIALAGFDAVIVDMEHGPHDLGTVRAAVLAASAHGLYTVVRPPDTRAALIGAVLDLGADGVLVPGVGSAADAAAVVAAARFSPQGRRGSNPWVRASGFAGTPDWLRRANSEVAVLVMVEGRDAVQDLDAILETDGLDGIFLGPVDLSHALGVPGQPGHPAVLAALADASASARRHGVAAGVFAPEAGIAREWFARGLGLVACGVDTHLLLGALRAVVEQARPGAVVEQAARGHRAR